jgi:4-hydroxy-2-oxoheptanedioate aldolase
VDIADEIYAVPGVDAVFVGPNDLAASLRDAEGTPPSKQHLEDTIQRVHQAAKRQGIASGIHVFSIEDAQRRINEGWQFIAVGSELKFMLQGAAAVAKQIHPELVAGELAKY